VLAAASGVCAAENMPPGYFEGTMVSFEGTATAGILTARGMGGELFECGYDAKSYIEFGKQRVTPAKLLDGDRLDVLVDLSGRGRTCYIRILHVLSPASTHAARPKAPAKQPRAFMPAATFTLSGIVVRSQGGFITVRGRDSEETFRVRRDTRFVGAGIRGDSSSLTLNQRVFVEGGRNSDGEMEAYQITWGELLTVH